MDRSAGLTATDACGRRSRGRPSAARAILAVLAALPAAAGEAEAVERAAGAAFQVGATAGGGRILVRWAAADRPSPYAAYLLLRRRADEAAFQAVGPSPIVPLTDPDDIEAVFPAGSAIRDDIERYLVPSAGPSLGMAILNLRAGARPDHEGHLQLLADTNYGVAVAEGLAYLDAAVDANTLYLYELWGAEDPDAPTADERLGKVWIASTPDTSLPEPRQLRSVVMAGEDADGKVYLMWDATTEPIDRESGITGFGYDVYRVAGGLDPNDPVPDPPGRPDDPNSGAVKVNRFPVVPVPSTDTARVPDFFFVDGGFDADPNVPRIEKGRSYKYWLFARDLLGQRGLPSAPVQVCVPDRGRPRQVVEVRTRILAGGVPSVEATWRANASDPNAPAGGIPYVDDTVAYNVYRFTNFYDVLRGPDPNFLVAGDVAGTSFLDSGAGSPGDAANHGVIFWYAVTAVDAPLCRDPANESAYSAPVRAVVYDTTPPTIAGAEAYCAPDPNLGSLLNLLCIRDCGPILSDPNQTVPDPNAFPDLVWCRCLGADGVWPTRTDDWGYRVAADASQPDMFGTRLYRGLKPAEFRPAEFRPVEEAFLTTEIVGGQPWAGFKTRETFLSRASQKIEYRLRALDRDSNLGPSREPAGRAGQPMPAFVPGLRPAPPVIAGDVHDPAAGTRTVTWHAPGVNALAGFILRLGPEDEAGAGTFRYLPQGNLYSETSLPPTADPDLCDPDHDGRIDYDGDGPDPKDVLITDTTGYLADLVAADPALGGIRDPLTGRFTYTFLPGDPDLDLEVRSVDIAGLVSDPATRSHLTAGDPNVRLPWPNRPAPPPATPLRTIRTSDAAGGYTELCWNQPSGDPFYVAAFRAVVEGGVARGLQQVSPLLEIAGYLDRGGPNELPCNSTCSMLLPDPDPANVACFRDYGASSASSHLYTVVGFRGPPAPGQIGDRDEREVQAVFGPTCCRPGVVDCTTAPGACP